ncbi:MAG TPA: hypothetical protein VF487_06035 [Chitinophagaceae bacterium]
MKKDIKLFVCTIFALVTCAISKAQSNTDADSIQRSLMKDSLNINDSIIVEIYNIRNNFLTQSLSINEDSTRNDQQKEVLIQALVQQTNDAVKSRLGEQKYDQYLEMIRRRVISRSSFNTARPLAN